jgi:hypothetical protein
MRGVRPEHSISRRQALGVIAAAASGLLGACAPVARFTVPAPRIPETDRVLQAFVATVVPGSGDSPNLVRAFSDPFYAFSPWRSWFASDLCRRAARAGAPRFDRLGERERIRIVSSGLTGDPVTRRVYTGAVFLAQVSVYVGLYEESGASPLLGFQGKHQFRGLAEVTYECPERFLACALTRDGNAA